MALPGYCLSNTGISQIWRITAKRNFILSYWFYSSQVDLLPQKMKVEFGETGKKWETALVFWVFLFLCGSFNTTSGTENFATTQPTYKLLSSILCGFIYGLSFCFSVSCYQDLHGLRSLQDTMVIMVLVLFSDSIIAVLWLPRAVSYPLTDYVKFISQTRLGIGEINLFPARLFFCSQL